MRRAIRLLVVLVIGIDFAWAWDEPAGFRGIPWGASSSQVKARIPELRCSQDCGGYLMIGEVRVYTLILFESGGMDAVSLTFPIDSFSL